MATDDALDAAIEETLRRAGQVYTSTGSLPVILSEADKQLSTKLEKVVDKQGANLRFSEASALLFRKQIRLVQEYTNKRLLGLTHDAAKKAIAIGTKDTVALAKALESRFTGLTQPLALDVQAFLDRNVKGTSASLLRQHQSSVNRYGERMIADFERQLRVGLLTGLSNAELVSRLVESGRLGGVSAGKLHQDTPGSFPKPTSYVKRRYWAERIVRTEVAYAHNAASLASIRELRVSQFPDMGKKILAHFDNRTAPDSIAVHGQIRKVDELFIDGAGRQYLHPPARPNDRETIVPWRLGWKELPSTQEAQAAVLPPEQAAVLPPGPEKSPNTLFEDIFATNEKVKLAKAAKAEAEAKATAAAAATAATEHAAKGKVEAGKQAETKASISAQKAAAKAQAAARVAELKAKTKAIKAQAAEVKKATLQKQKAIKQLEALAAKEAARKAKLAAAAAKAAAKEAAKAAREQARLAKRRDRSLAHADDALRAAEAAWQRAKTSAERVEVLKQIPKGELQVEKNAMTWEGKRVPNLGFMARSHAFAERLSVSEKTAIQRFGGSSYTYIRQSEASGEPSGLSDEIQAGLRKGTPEKGVTVWRGVRNVPAAAFDQWLSGEPFGLGENGNQGTASTSWNQAVAAGSFGGLTPKRGKWTDGGSGGSDNRVLLKLKNARGVAIEGFAPWSNEREVLQPRDARFRATKIYQIAPRCYVIEAEGLED